MHIRFINNLNTPQCKINGFLTLTEIHLAEKHICKLVQEQCFASEIKDLKAGKPVDTTLQRLAPFVDTHIDA